MKRLWYVFAVMLLMISVTGCSNHTSYMNIMQNPQLEALPEGKASVTFFRYSSLGWIVQAPIAMKDGDDLTFVGIASVDTKIRQIVDAGEHIWVVGGEDASLVKGKLVAGKNYYVRIEPRIGFWKARFEGIVMVPTQLASEDIQKQLATCQYVEIDPSGDAWYKANKPSMEDKLLDAMNEWEKAPESRSYLNPSDGVDAIY